MVEDSTKQYLIPKGRLRRFVLAKLQQFNGRVSADALTLLMQDADKFVELAIESAWLYAVQQKKKTILAGAAEKGIDCAHNLFAPQLLDGIIFRLKKAKEEVEAHDNARTALFEKDGRGRKAKNAENAELGKA